VFSPIDGQVLREAIPYRNDPSFRGVVIQGIGEWLGYEVKLFYVQGIVSGPVRAGQAVGTAQDLGGRYPGITNHVHLEVRRGGMVIDPDQLFDICF
jgi:hypothetical protein